MLQILHRTWEWPLSAATIFGAMFSFLFFGTSNTAKIDIVWVYAIIFIFLCSGAWLIGAFLDAMKQGRRTVATILGVFSDTEDVSTDLNFLLDPNESFSSLLKCSIFYRENGVELYIGSAYVSNVQEDRRVQLKVSVREPSKKQIWEKISCHEKEAIEKLLVKVGERVS